jgi:hypothetical protein
VYLHVSLASALDGGERPASRPGRFIPGEGATLYSLDKRQVGTQSKSGHSGGRKILSPCPKLNPDLPDPSLVTVLTQLSRFPLILLVKSGKIC